MHNGEGDGAFVSLASVTESILSISILSVQGSFLHGLAQAIPCLRFPMGASFLD